MVDADQLARDAVEVGRPALAAILQAFGPGVLGANGGLDRKALGAVVFGAPAELAKLNAIVHPEVARLAVETFARLGEEGHPWAGYEVPLLVEGGLHKFFRPVVVVAVPRDVQLARLRLRDELDADACEARIASQLPLAEKLAVADFVIDNGGDEVATRARVKEVCAAISRWPE